MTARERLRSRVSALTIVGAVLLVVACGTQPTTTAATTAAPPPPPARKVAASASAIASVIASAQATEFGEGDFTTSDRNRDPFRNYADIFVAQSKRQVNIQHKVVAERFSLDELKLVAIITGNTAARAMFIDPQGKGHVITRGEFVGRSELVKLKGNNAPEYDLNWRVDRIREGDVVFIREDPSRPNIPATTRVIALRPEGDAPPPRR